MGLFFRDQPPGDQTTFSAPHRLPGPSRGILARLRDAVGGWLGPTESEGTQAAQYLRREKAASGPRGILDLPWFLPYYDTNYTGETTAMRIAYRQMWADPNVKAACSGLIFSVAGLDLKFLPSDKTNAKRRRDAKFCDFVFNERMRGQWPEICWSILSGACMDGFSVNEVITGEQQGGKWGGNWIYRALKPKDPINDVILQTDQYRNITGLMGLKYNAGQEFSPADFVIFRLMPLFDQPVGMSVFRSVYSRYWLLDTALKWRAVGLEKRAYPFLLGTWKDASQQPTLEAMLARAKWQNWASVPEGSKLEAINLAGEGDKIFSDAIKDLKHDIFLGIRGAILQALEGSMGVERGNSQVHKETSELIEWYLVKALESAFNDRETGLIKNLLDLNYICPEYPKAAISSVDLNELQIESQIDTVLHGIIDLSKDEMYERYNRTPPKDAKDTIPAASAAQPGMPGQAGGQGGGGAGGMPFVEKKVEYYSEKLETRRQGLVEKYGRRRAGALMRKAAEILDGKRSPRLEPRRPEPPATYAEKGTMNVPPFQIVVPPAPPPDVKVEAPTVHVHVPEQKPPVVNVKTEPKITVKPPDIKLPPQPAPVVNVNPTIELTNPEQQPPVVHVHPQAAAVEVIEAERITERAQPKVRLVVKRDRNNLITEISEE